MAETITRLGDNWCDTYVEVTKTSFEWKIHNFSFSHLQMGSGKSFKSTTFSDTADSQTKWYLTIFPTGVDDKCLDYVSVFLHLEASDRNELSAKIKFAVIDANGQLTAAKEKENRYTVGNRSSGFRRFISKSILSDASKGLLSGDVLTVFCELAFITDSHSVCGRIGSDGQQVLDDLNQLFTTRKGADVVLVAGDHEVKAHKAILMARSQVFCAMFEHPLEENQQNRVEIKDIDHKILEELLRYIYTGSVSDLEHIGADLLVAADKYNLVKLKAICESSLRSIELTANNAIRLLVLSDMYSTPELKLRAIHYIRRHANQVMKSEEWKTSIDCRPHLMEELLKNNRNESPIKRLKTEEN